MDPKCVFVRVWWGITWTPSVFTLVCVCGVYMLGAPWLACQRAVSIICFLKFSFGRSGRGDSIPGPAAMPPKKSWKEKADVEHAKIDAATTKLYDICWPIRLFSDEAACTVARIDHWRSVPQRGPDSLPADEKAEVGRGPDSVPARDNVHPAARAAEVEAEPVHPAARAAETEVESEADLFEELVVDEPINPAATAVAARQAQRIVDASGAVQSEAVITAIQIHIYAYTYTCSGLRLILGGVAYECALYLSYYYVSALFVY